MTIYQVGKFPITKANAPSIKEASGVSEKIEAALEYTQKGLAIIPIAAESKKPLVSWKKYQTIAPTENEVKDSLKSYPGADIGIVTGKRHNLFVIDCDSQEAYESIQALLPDSLILPVVKTPRGYHLYFSYP
ncbi:MAG TPA: bifunctional DNA primase/polymerase, partial [Candidatus Paceibacterota bacterium]|nr:bifunctional DNA primase/polymerase [Candidatus Paceibacterota bacterium]